MYLQTKGRHHFQNQGQQHLVQHHCPVPMTMQVSDVANIQKAIQNVLINPLDARSASLMLCTCMIESSANLSVIAGCIMQL